MVITILEADVAPDQVGALEATYRQAAGQLDQGIYESFLVRGLKDSGTYRIVTVWESHAALEAMRQSGVTPRGVVVFRAAGAEPAPSVYEVVTHTSHGGVGRSGH